MTQIVLQENLSRLSADFLKLWGPGLYTVGSLSNLRVGSIGGGKRAAVAYRFRAVTSAAPVSLGLYYKKGSGGYSAHAGGIIVARIVDCLDNGEPNTGGTVYGQTRIDCRSINTEDFYREIQVTNPRHMTAGNRYCIWITNESGTDGEFMSVNTSRNGYRAGRPTRWLSNDDLGCVYSTTSETGPWVSGSTVVGNDQAIRSPIFTLRYTNDMYQGQSAVESGTTVPRAPLVSANGPIHGAREVFDPAPRARRIGGISFRASCVTPGPLKVELKRGNTVLATARITETANQRTETAGTSEILLPWWFDVQLPQDVYIRRNDILSVEFTPEGGSSWRFPAHKNGSNMGVPNSVAFVWSEAAIRGSAADSWRILDYHNHNGAGKGNEVNFDVVLHCALPLSALPSGNGGQQSGGTQSGGGGGTQTTAREGTFGNFTNNFNFVWVKYVPSGNGEDHTYRLMLMSCFADGRVMSHETAEQHPDLMADRTWNGVRTLPAIVWPQDSLPQNIRSYTRTTITIDKQHFPASLPWHTQGVWEGHMQIANKNQSQRIE